MSRTLPPWSAPSSLGPRFGVLGWAVVTTALALTEVVAGHVIDPQPQPGDPCYPVWLGLFGQGPLAVPVGDSEEFGRAVVALQRSYPDCFVRPYPRLPLGSAVALGTVIMVAAAVIAYLLWPRWRIVRHGLVPAEPLPGVGARLAELRERAGARVTFLADLYAPHAGGLAFGRARRRYVLVNRGLIGLRAHDPAAFDAIVLHELAHVRNRDIDVAYLTVLLWRLFVAVFLIPVVLLFHSALDRPSDLLFQLVLLTVLVLLTHHAVLRERELEADARAAHWLGDPAVLRRIFAGPAAGPTRAELAVLESWSLPRTAWQWLVARVLRLHPEPGDRAAALDDRARWLAPNPAQAAVVGLTVGLTWIPALLTGAALTYRLHVPLGPLRYLPGIVWPALGVPVLLLALAVGAMVWRGVLCLSPSPRLWGRIVLTGASFGAGLAAGELLTPQYSPLGAGALGAPYQSVLPPGSRWAYAGVLLLGGFAAVMWLAGCAAAWRAAVHRSPRRAWPGITLAAAPVVLCLPALWGLRFTGADTPEQRDAAAAYLADLAHQFAATVPLTAGVALAAAAPLVGLALSGWRPGRDVSRTASPAGADQSSRSSAPR